MSVKLRKRELPSGKIQLYLDIYRHGSRKTEALFILSGDRFHDKETRRMSEQIRAKRELDLEGQMQGVTGTHNLKSSFFKYFKDLADLRPSPNSRKSWNNALYHLDNFAGESIVFGDLTPTFFEKFKGYLLKAVSPNSAQIYFSRIKTALRQAVKDNIIPVNHASNVIIKKQERLPVHLSLEEVRKLDKTPCPNDQVKVAFLFSCFSGLRYSDVVSLTWDKVKDGSLMFKQQKTGAYESLPLTSEALRILEDQKTAKPSPRVKRQFPENVVFFLPCQANINLELKTWAKRAGIEKRLSFHKSRHTFATLMLSSGVDLYTTSKMLGHKDLATTQIYAKVIDAQKQAAADKMPTLNGEYSK